MNRLSSSSNIVVNRYVYYTHMLYLHKHAESYMCVAVTVVCSITYRIQHGGGRANSGATRGVQTGTPWNKALI